MGTKPRKSTRARKPRKSNQTERPRQAADHPPSRKHPVRAAMNPFDQGDDIAETLNHVRHGLIFLANNGPSETDPAPDGVAFGQFLCMMTLVHALEAAERQLQAEARSGGDL